MLGRTILSTALAVCAFALPARADAQQTALSAMEDYTTVLTMAPDGAWGTATEITTSLAIARAIGNCKAMAKSEIGCGASSTTIRAGWSLGFRCGSENIVVAAKDLAEAEQAAAHRERELRQIYVPDLPACVRVVMVDPAGAIIAPKAETSTSARTGKTAADLPVWRTITLGTYRDVNALREDLDSLNCGRPVVARDRRDPDYVPGTSTPLQCVLGESAAEIIGRPAFTLNQEQTSVGLVVLSVPELGFTGERVAIADIYARAKQLGLELCAAEVGPQLRLQYLDQPLGEFLRIAMEPIATYEGELLDLTVANGGASLLLVTGAANAEAIVHARVRFVFTRPTRVANPTVP
jgi:hypothetical protein